MPTETIQKITFKKLIMTIGNLPSSYVESLSYYECMLWLCNYLENTVVPAVNNNGEAVEELQGLFVELKTYVDTYFENLDVQEQINNKLDEMAEDGTLTNLIQTYVDPFIEEQNTTISNAINSQNEEIATFKAQTTLDINEIDEKVDAVTSGSPSGVYATVSALTTADPDHSKIYLVTADGKWYYYSSTDTDWVAGGTYQATSISSSDPIIENLTSVDNQQGYSIINKRGILDLEPGDINGSGGNWDGNYNRLRCHGICYANEDLYIIHSPLYRCLMWTFDDYAGTNATNQSWIIQQNSSINYYKIESGTYFKLLFDRKDTENPPVITDVIASPLYQSIVILNEQDYYNMLYANASKAIINNSLVDTKIIDTRILAKEKGYIGSNGTVYYGNVFTSTNYEYCSEYIPLNSNQVLNMVLTLINGSNKEAWTCFCCYDKDFNFIEGTRTISTSYTTSGSDKIQNITIQTSNTNVQYVKISYRTYNSYSIYALIKSKYMNNLENYINKQVISSYTNNIFNSVAHQGYSVTSQYYGNSRLSSYRGAKLNGFNWGECDVQWSSDNVPMCCHDASFMDGDTEVVIADHTEAELKTYTYYGETIASLDEVVALCKKLKLGLYIDKIDSMSIAKIDTVIGIVTKYQMQDNVKFLTISETRINHILDWYSKAKIALVIEELTSGYITLANSLATADNEITIDFSASATTTSEILELISTLDPSIKLEVWTIDNETTYTDYLPFVTGITSNKLSYNKIQYIYLP